VKRILPWLAVALAIAIADQATKALLASHLAPGESIAVTGFFNLVHVFNKGAAFSILAGASGWQREFFVAVALVASALILYLLVKHANEPRFCAGLALILGGALGNVWDRLAHGHVVDFLDFHALGYHWPAFNLADSAITVGAALLIVDSLLATRNARHAGG
jgi:signal peptidase II